MGLKQSCEKAMQVFSLSSVGTGDVVRLLGGALYSRFHNFKQPEIEFLSGGCG